MFSVLVFCICFYTSFLRLFSVLIWQHGIMRESVVVGVGLLRGCAGAVRRMGCALCARWKVGGGYRVFWDVGREMRWKA